MTECISGILTDIAKREQSARDSLFLRLHKQFPYDSGLIVSLLLNYTTLQPGECLVMSANEPHAYI